MDATRNVENLKNRRSQIPHPPNIENSINSSPNRFAVQVPLEGTLEEGWRNTGGALEDDWRKIARRLEESWVSIDIARFSIGFRVSSVLINYAELVFLDNIILSSPKLVFFNVFFSQIKQIS